MGWTEADYQAHLERLKQPPPARAIASDGGTRVRVEGGVLRFTLPVTPRTKKTSQRVAFIPSKGNICEKCGKVATRNHRRCPECGGRLGFTKVLPSEAYETFFAEAMKFAPKIRAELTRAGATLPIKDYVQVTAIFYRDRDSGDLLGYEQALADWLQAPLDRNGKKVRDGAGVISDDAQIISWDGSRPAKDATAPRIEVAISVMALRPVEGDLFAEQEEKW